MSKSLGNIVDPLDAARRFGPDPLRLYLVKEIPFGGDGDFSWERFDERYTADLADGLGNLASRSLAMIEKYRGGTVPEGPQTGLDQAGTTAVAEYAKAMDALDLKGGAEAAWTLVTAANQYIVQSAPWSLAKAGKDAELDAVLGALARCLVRLAVLTGPYLPGKAQELWEHLGQDALVTGGWRQVAEPKVAGAKVRKPEGLFPKPPPPNP